MAEITAARINNLQSRINLILGNGAGTTGYGQALTSSQVIPNSIIEAEDINAIYADIVKARIHQVGPADATVTSIAQVLEDQNIIADETSNIIDNTGAVTSDPQGTKKGLSDFEDLMQAVENDKQLIHPNQASLETVITSTRTSIWNGMIYHEFVVTFASNDIMRHYFNAGGEIRIDPSNTNASTPKGLDWAQLCNEIGVVRFDHDSTSGSSGTGTAIGSFDLTFNYQTIYNKVGAGTYSGVYAGNTYTIKARLLTAEQVEFRCEFNDIAVDGSIDNNVDGTLRNVISLFRATGDVNVAAPGIFTNIQLSGDTPSSQPRYTLTPSSSAVNEGSAFTITRSTFLVPTGTSVPYTISGISPTDLLEGSLTGAFTTNANGLDVKTFTILADSETEGVEYFDMRLDSDLDAIRVTINDTSESLPQPTYQISPSSSSVAEGGGVAFTLTTTNVANGTRVPYIITGIQREDLSDGTYDWNDWYDEFSTSYLSGYTRSQALEAKDFVFPFYNSNTLYNTVYGPRYGLFRLPDAAGIAYWSRTRLRGASDTEFQRIFWSAVDANLRTILWQDANGTEGDNTRAQTPNKNYLIGVGSTTAEYTWDDWYDEWKNITAVGSAENNFAGATKQQVLDAKDYVLQFYMSNGTFQLSDYSTRYGLYRKPAADGVAYWVNYLLTTNLPQTVPSQFVDTFFYSASVAGVVQPDGQTDAQRMQTADKEFLYGGVGTVVYDRGSYGTVGDRGTPGGNLSTSMVDNFTVYQNTAFKNYLVKNDYFTEGNETMTVTLADQSNISASITVNDTSLSDEDDPITILPIPTINSFNFSRSSITWGEPTHVAWNVDSAVSINISIAGVGLAFTQDFTQAIGNTNDFIINQADGTGTITAGITAQSQDGTTVTATQTIEVGAPAPTISSFTTSPAGNVTPDTPVRLLWTTANASSGVISTNYGAAYSNLDLPNGQSGAYTFTDTELGNKTATLTLENLSGQTIAQTINFNVISEITPEAPTWQVAPEWAGLNQTVQFGTTGRGFLQADGDIDTVTYLITGPSGGMAAPITASYSPGGFFYTNNYAFTQEGLHTVSMTVSGTGGSLTAEDSVTVLPAP